MNAEVLLVEFVIDPPHIAAFGAALADNAAASLTEPGCRRFDVCTDPQRPGRFVLYEIYDDADAVVAHLAASHFKVFDLQCAEWVLHKTVQRLVLHRAAQSLPPARI